MPMIPGLRAVPRFALCCLLPAVLRGAPVAVNDSYTLNEDTVLSTASASLVSADFEPAANVVTGDWAYLDRIRNNQNGQTSDSYPTDGAGRDWRSLGFDPTTSTVSPWGTSPMPIQAGGIGAFPNAPNVLQGLNTSGGPYNVTTYLFRKTFSLTAAQAAVTSWQLRHVVDDGMIVYLNGQQIHQVRMAPDQIFPTGPVTTNTSVINSIADESVYTSDTITIPTGLLVPGNNVLAIELHQAGGSSYTSSDVGLDVQFSPGGDTTQGFVYADDTFGTNRPNNASGATVATGGNPGGMLTVETGRVNNSAGFSGGWRRTFDLGAPASVRIAFDWRIGTRGGLEPDEFSAFAMSVNGTRYGDINVTQGRFIGQLFGTGNGDGDLNTPWARQTYDVNLPAGSHTLILGGYTNKTTVNSEWGVAFIDNVSITTLSSGTGILANDTGNPVRAELVSGPSLGSLVLDPSGNFSYSPPANYFGTQSFTYRAFDATDPAPSNTATVELIVSPVNDAPVAAPDNYTTNQQQTLTVSAAEGVLRNDTDVDNDRSELVAQLVTNVTAQQGTLVLRPDGSFTFTPAPAFAGQASFIYRCSDGSATSQDVTVRIDVVGLGSPPTAVNDVYSTPRNTPLTVTALTAGTVTDDVVPYGSSTVSSIWKYLDNGSDQGTAWRAPEFDDATWKSGGAELGYGNGDEVTIVEDNPTPGYQTGESNRYATTYFRRTFTIGELYNVTAAEVSLVFDDGGIVFLNGSELGRTPTMPAAADNPNPAFDFYCANSSNNATSNFTVPLASLRAGENSFATEIHQNLPTSSDISFNLRLRLTRAVAASLLANDTDADAGTVLRILSHTNPTNGSISINPDGTFTYTPNNGFLGTDTFTYIAQDNKGLNSGSATVAINVVPGPNVRPRAVADTYTATEDIALDVPAATGVLANDSDADGDPLTAVLVTGPTSGNLTLLPDGSFRYVPKPDFAGTDVFTYSARDDGGLSTAVTVTITVNNVNDEPVALPDAFAGDPGTRLDVSAPGVLANDTDADTGTILTAVLVSPPDAGTLTLNTDGSFSFVPPGAFTGNITFQYRASDGIAQSAPVTVTLRFNGRPVPNPDSYEGTEDTALSISAPGVLANDTDPDNDPLTAALVTPPLKGTLALQANGSFLYTPRADSNGVDTFTYRANDGLRDSASTTNVTLTIAPVNDAPVASNDSFGTGLDSFLAVSPAEGVLRNDTDVDGQTLTAILIDTTANGTLTLAPDGSFTYQPNPGFSGIDRFTYRASDGELTSAIATATISVGVDLAKVVINEIMYSPATLNPAEEFLEIFNGNPGGLDVSGWKIDAGIGFTIPDGTVIPGSGFLVIAANPTAFSAAYGSVPLLRGGWTGELSNGGERVRLVTASGALVSEVTYADEGDWAERREETLSSETGWNWFARHDGGGSSLELINPAVSSKVGANWAASQSNPTPGQPNSVRSAATAPLIDNVMHSPAIPSSTQPVTVTARVRDDAIDPLQVSLFWRVSTATPGAFAQLAMSDLGTAGDGAAGDAVFGAVIPPQAVGSSIEFYVAATDAAGLGRTWPPAGRNLGGTLVQAANAFYRVDEEVWNSNYPIYRLAGATADTDLFMSGSWNRNSDAQINVTLITRQGSDIEIRYRCGLRVRGAGSRGNSVNNWRLNIPKDNDWNGDTEMNLNVWHPHLGHLASTLMDAAGLIHERSWPVQVRLNGTNRASNNQQHSFGYFIHLQPAGGEYLNYRRPLDDDGNLYKKVRPHQNFTVRESSPGVPNANGYISDGWIKQSNEGLNDWTDLNTLMRTFAGSTAPTVPQMEAVVNLDYWFRWLAFQAIVNHNETNLSNGSNDDYGLYRGIVDPRFIPLAHDFDTVWGLGGNTSSLDPTNPTATVYQVTGNFATSGERLPALAPMFTIPEANQRYKAQMVDLLNTVFLPARFNAAVENALGNWGGPAGGVSTSARDAIRTFNQSRRDHILRTVLGYGASYDPPAPLTVTTSLPIQNGFPRATAANNSGLSGTVDSSRVRRVRINNVDILPDNYNDTGGGSAAGDGEGGNGLAPWSAGTAFTLRPGINRLTIRALGAGDAVIDSQMLEIWFDDGSVAQKTGTLAASETWIATGGPWVVSGTLTVPSGVTLTIGAGASVFMEPGASIEVTGTGRLVAQGTEANRIRFSSAPGATGPWGGIVFRNATLESRITFADIENAAGTAQNGITAKCHVLSGSVILDSMAWGNSPAVTYLHTDSSSFLVSNSTFPSYPGTFNTTTAPPLIVGRNGPPAAGYAIFRRNYFGHSWGTGDTISFTGGNRPAAILQVIGNTFDGSTDECLELNATDAWIENNVFFGVHQDTRRSDPADTANAIGGGEDGTEVSEWTILNNLFYDVDHAVLARNRNRFSFVSNTVFRVSRSYGSGTGIAAFSFSDSGAPLSPLTAGQGAYIADNIIDDCPALITNYNPASLTVSMDGNLLPAGLAWTGPGSGNFFTSSRLGTSSLVPPATLTSGTADQGRAAASAIQSAFVPGPLSPALCTGMFGGNRGGLQKDGIAIGGAPPVPVTGESVTLAVGPGGSFIAGTAPAFNWGYTSYRFSLDGGPLSAETPIGTPLTLTGLAEGPHQVTVLGRTDAGVWQTVPTASRTFTVRATAQPVVINEILAENVNAWPQGLQRPDVMEFRNLGSNPVSMEGWSLSERPLATGGSPRYIFPAGTVIPAGGYLVLRLDQAGFGLDRDGDAVYLHSGTTAAAPLIDGIAFGFQVADKSIGRLCTDLSWALTDPSLGAANQPAELSSASGLRINEWSAANDFILEDDFVELHNPASLPVALAGLALTDDPINYPARSPFAPLSFIGPQGFIRCIADGRTDAGSNHLAFGLNRLREPLALLDSSGRVIDQIMLEPQTEDVSQGRLPDGGSALSFFVLPTPGYSNATDLAALNPLLENLRITEIMYNPPGAGTPEFVELHNISASATLDLARVRFVNGISFQFAPGSVLVPGAFTVISNVSQAAFLARYPGAPFAGTYSGSLSNAGERLRMEIDGAQLGILDFDYLDNWYPSTDGGGASLEIVSATAPRNSWGLKSSWRATVPNPGLNGIFGVFAGEDTSVAIPAPLELEGIVSFGSQNPAGVSFGWTRVSGPAPVTFSRPTELATTATFTTPGVYVLRLTATGTSAVSDDLTVVVEDSYDAWAVRFLGSADPNVTGADRDPDRDGIPNLIEFALGMNPAVSSQQGLPQPSVEGGVLSITYPRYPGAGLTYIAEVSDDLVTWNSGSVVESRIGTEGATEIWKASDTRPVDGHSRRYLRVRVVLQR
jgi:hypothetical protein